MRLSCYYASKSIIDQIFRGKRKLYLRYMWLIFWVFPYVHGYCFDMSAGVNKHSLILYSWFFWYVKLKSIQLLLFVWNPWMEARDWQRIKGILQLMMKLCVVWSRFVFHSLFFSGISTPSYKNWGISIAYYSVWCVLLLIYPTTFRY